MGDFIPEEYLTKLGQRRRNPDTKQWETIFTDYLEVKWRMVWYRQENAENTQTVIKDKIIDINNKFAYFELQVTDSRGNIEIGVGSESGDDFEDYIEKAYTKAYGRALASLGYGTQFASELNEANRIVDSPVAEKSLITEAQKRAIYAIYNSLGMREDEIREIMNKRYKKSDSKKLTKYEASDLIDYLNHIKASSSSESQRLN
ncbi:MAG: hypothetical protein PHP06_07165 [Clostridia bacterium]|nr:hypothetical protein [Clostridia bacterium]